MVKALTIVATFAVVALTGVGAVNGAVSAPRPSQPGGRMTQSATDPLVVVQRMLEAFEAMDLDRALTYIAPDAEYTNIPRGTVRGHAGVRSVLEPFFAPVRENKFIIIRKAVTGDTVFIERLDRHRLDHGWRELPVNSVFEVHDGVVTVWREYFDAATANRIHTPDAK